MIPKVSNTFILSAAWVSSTLQKKQFAFSYCNVDWFVDVDYFITFMHNHLISDVRGD